MLQFYFAVIATFTWSKSSSGRDWDREKKLKLAISDDGTWYSNAVYEFSESDGHFGGS